MSAKFDRVVVATIEAKFTSSWEVKATGAFVSSSTGATHGSTVCHHWAPDTVKTLMSLRSMMERDMNAMHFDGVAVPAQAPSNLAADLGKSGGGGLGEHLRGPDEQG